MPRREDVVVAVSAIGGIANAAISGEIFGLIDIVLKMITTAQENKEECKQLETSIKDLSEKMQVLKKHENLLGSWQQAGLEEVLEQCKELVDACQSEKTMMAIFKGKSVAKKFAALKLSINRSMHEFSFLCIVENQCNSDRKGRSLQRLNSACLHLKQEANIDSALVAGLGITKFTRAVLVAACDNFGGRNKIKVEGRYGVKYKGVFRNGEAVAIKHIRNVAVLMDELNVIPHPRNKHFVRVHGYCTNNGDHLLVTEYMPNGSLYDHLHGRLQTSMSPVLSSWKTRIDIARGVATAIYHLQNWGQSPVIHRDICSYHILLDADFSPRLSGLGCAIWGRPRVDPKFRRPGYADPSVHAGDSLTPASDVYSFGVLLAELLTGTDPFRNRNLGNYVATYINAEELWKALDCRPPACLETLRALEPLGDTVIGCLAIPSKRLSILEVVGHLRDVFAKLPAEG